MSEAPVETGVDEITPAPRRIGHRAFDIVMSVCAISISVISLVVAIEHGRTQHDLLAASNWPFLGTWVNDGSDADGKIQIGVVNSGVGPAKIKSFELFYKDRPVTSGLDLLRACCGLSTDPAQQRAQLPAGMAFSLIDESVLRAGDDVKVLTLSRIPRSPVIEKLAHSLRDLRFRACYCSVLDQCFVGDLWTTRTREVRECPAPAHPFEPNGH